MRASVVSMHKESNCTEFCKLDTSKVMASAEEMRLMLPYSGCQADSVDRLLYVVLLILHRQGVLDFIQADTHNTSAEESINAIPSARLVSRPAMLYGTTSWFSLVVTLVQL